MHLPQRSDTINRGYRVKIVHGHWPCTQDGILSREACAVNYANAKTSVSVISTRAVTMQNHCHEILAANDYFPKWKLTSGNHLRHAFELWFSNPIWKPDASESLNRPI